MASVRLAPECEERLDRLAKQTGRSKSYYIKEAVEESLPRLEYIYGLDEKARKIRAGEMKTRPLEDVRSDLGI